MISVLLTYLNFNFRGLKMKRAALEVKNKKFISKFPAVRLKFMNKMTAGYGRNMFVWI